jgi:hypothetical protein
VPILGWRLLHGKAMPWISRGQTYCQTVSQVPRQGQHAAPSGTDHSHGSIDLHRGSSQEKALNSEKVLDTILRVRLKRVRPAS